MEQWVLRCKGGYVKFDFQCEVTKVPTIGLATIFNTEMKTKWNERVMDLAGLWGCKQLEWKVLDVEVRRPNRISMDVDESKLFEVKTNRRPMYVFVEDTAYYADHCSSVLPTLSLTEEAMDALRERVNALECALAVIHMALKVKITIRSTNVIHLHSILNVITKEDIRIMWDLPLTPLELKRITTAVNKVFVSHGVRERTWGSFDFKVEQDVMTSDDRLMCDYRLRNDPFGIFISLPEEKPQVVKNFIDPELQKKLGEAAMNVLRQHLR